MRKTLLTIFAAAAGLSMAAQETVYFQDDFEWLEPWSAYTNSEGVAVGDNIGDNDPDAYAPFITTPKVEGVSALDALKNKGYDFVRATTKTEGECIYLQKTYLKFGKNNYQGGIVLPAIENVPENAGATMTINWSVQRQGTGTIDPTKLVIIVVNGDDTKSFEVPEHGLEKNAELKWITATVPLTDATITKDTKITIRPEDAQWKVNGQHRWFLKDITLKGSSSAGVDAVVADTDAPVEYFNLQGIRVAQPENGLYIRRQGSTVTKVLVK